MFGALKNLCLGRLGGAANALPPPPPPPDVVFSTTLKNASSGFPGGSARTIIGPIAEASLGLVRVTFSYSAGFVVDHISIGVASGTAGNTVAMPVELKTNGQSGFNQPVNAGSFTTDWTAFNWAANNNLVVIFDWSASGNGNCDVIVSVTAHNACEFVFDKPSYNEAIASGSTGFDSGDAFNVTEIETQAP